MSDNSINILFLGGAKRVEMARHFIAAARSLGREARIFSYEKTTTVPIASVGEVIIGLKWSDQNIYADLKKVVDRHKISIIVPFVDGAVGVAAEFVNRYPDAVFSPVGTRQQSETMFDKVEAARIFERAGLPIPETYVPGAPRLRLIAKPRHGSASKGVIAINSLDQLNAVLDHADDYLIQERVDNRREITVDCYVSVRSGEIKAAVPRTRDAVSGGEVNETTTIHRADIEQLSRATLSRLNLRGAVTVQLIEDLDAVDDANRLMIMEINPRLGGGAVTAVHAGANLPLMIIRESLGMDVEPCTDWKEIILTRYPADVVFPKN
jgi:carbamoyl-phosphate synthase large subunit